MRSALVHLVPLVFLAGCAGEPPPPAEAPSPCPPEARTCAPCPAPACPAVALPHAPGPVGVDLGALEAELVGKHGEAARPRIKRGLAQVASLWRAEDGDLGAFVRAQFLAEPAAIDATFARLEGLLEQLEGHLHEMGRALRFPTDTDTGPLFPLDPLLAGYEPAAHLYEDLFQSKIAFVALLNFPLSDLATKSAEGERWSRRRWAEDRLTGRFALRIPGAVAQDIARAGAEGDLYISDYNVWMHHLVSEKGFGAQGAEGRPGAPSVESGERPFPSGLRLISHWNLRDELKANYGDPRGLEKQRMIVQVMERIVTQTIPAAVIDDPRVDWNPFTNEVRPAPAAEIEPSAPNRAPLTTASARPEPFVRYEKLLASFRASRRADPFSPIANSAMKRRFELTREIGEDRVRGLFLSILGSKTIPKVAAEIERRLGRKLGPQDLWYAGFKPRGGKTEAELDAITRKRYPDAKAFSADIPRILVELGFPKDHARTIADKIAVDPSRGAGHAMEPRRRGDKARLRTRIEKDGMNYKGYNIAVHELGHNVEQVLSLYDVDHTLLAGVPNNAFTEALAFTFQARDLELLGLSKPTAESERDRVLGELWSAWEIAGVALVETDVWHWLYEHPEATAEELGKAAVTIAKRYWNQYYAPLLGSPDSALLAIYSHAISTPLYLPDYPLGHLIAFQIEEHVRKQGKLGPEFERMAKYGSVLPDLWMKHATGEPISAGPLLRAAEKALGGKP
ncbi:hypothetical protein [Polyangium spumosum]|uniref:hypothetical protein n=1 Tax=Polyangium spumosum TaxID=889282 RepID=UPI00197CC284|nr:hypothetical protein [Polyangium spumosum]